MNLRSSGALRQEIAGETDHMCSGTQKEAASLETPPCRIASWKLRRVRYRPRRLRPRLSGGSRCRPGAARARVRRRRTGVADPPVQYLVGTPKGRPSRLEKDLLAKHWQQARDGVQVKLLAQDSELYVFAESVDRVTKERAMRKRQMK